MAKPHSAALALGVSAALLAAPATAATLQHSEPLRGYRALAQAGARKPTSGEPATLSFNAFNRDFVVELEPNARLAQMQASLRLGPDTGAYRGSIAGRPGSWARLVLTPEGPTGLLYDGETLYGVEVPSDSVGASTGPTMFRLADVYFAPGELACERGAVAYDGAQAVAVIGAELATLTATGATLNLDLGAVADFEFYQAFGASAETALLARFNNVDGIFSEQVGVQISVAEIAVFTQSDDPFTASAASTLLDELAQYRGANAAQDAQGLTHLFTGRDLDGSTAGIAFLGSVCARRPPGGSRSYGVGLSEGRRGATIDSLVAAHEIGHNFGAPHDAEAGSDCASTPATFLMAPSMNGSTQFSTCSVAEMQPEISSAGCLTPIGGANVSIAMPPRADALVGVAFTHTATIANLGASAASDVTFAATAGQGLELVGVDAGAAVCTLVPPAVTCTLGTLPAGAARNVALTLQPRQVGALDLAASVAANEDSRASDNAAASTIDAAPVVDLVVTGTPSDVDVNRQTTIAATLANEADFTATAVTVTAGVSAGLRPDQALLDGQPCAIAGQTVTCPTRSLAPRSAVTLAMTATGLAAGGERLTVSASASEADGAPGDNQASLQVNVRALATSAGGSGGGGGSSWWTLGALLAAVARRRAGARRT